MAEVLVVGAGVIGLTTALTLQERGHRVRVVGASTGAAITSSVAGAIWFPFFANPRERVSRWAGATRRWLTDLARLDSDAGVDVLRMLELDDQDHTPWWAEELEDLSLEAADDAGDDARHWNGARFGWRFTAPRVDPRLHLRWLQSRLEHPIATRRLASIDEAFDAAHAAPDLVVNCSGLAARTLCNDAAVRPLYGQVVIVSPDGLDRSAAIADERDQSAVFYLIPRRDEVVIGGCTAEWPHPVTDGTLPTPDPALREAMLARAARYGVRPTRVLRDVAGLRPYRDTVRVERDPANPRLIHNYGHGGSGYTIARGCALEVASLVEQS